MGANTEFDNCKHPADAVFWNPYNKVIQCHRCGAQIGAEPETMRWFVTYAVDIDPDQDPNWEQYARDQIGSDMADLVTKTPKRVTAQDVTAQVPPNPGREEQ